MRRAAHPSVAEQLAGGLHPNLTSLRPLVLISGALGMTALTGNTKERYPDSVNEGLSLSAQ